MNIHELIATKTHKTPNAIAISATDSPPVTFADLLAHLNRTVEQLNANGVGRNDRVATVLPNGPQMALAFLAVAAGATCAPLNLAYRQAEFEFYLADLNAKALLIQRNLESPARAVARSLQIPILEVNFAAAGKTDIFSSSPPISAAHQGGWAHDEDLALILHTSGTTSRPKQVPLTQTNVCASAQNIARTLALTPADCCLNIMPLFHIHGLMAAVLASLVAGGSVICTPGLIAPKFSDWLTEFRPTWYTAVPTMHQIILAHVASDGEISTRAPLRFIRSSSAPLAPSVLDRLEQAFGVPVIEAYGMTEAAHQMASNPLPPRSRKPGSVGIAAGPEIAIMDEAGHLLAPNATGEIVIRGQNVMQGYANNLQANASAFTNGWFRTGDQGYLDLDGYLFISGRIKELINRGGEKITPRQVDEVLLAHPSVAQAVTFALPDARLGEEVAAAVVLRPDRAVTERELREFAATRLADFQVPRRVIFLDEIPKGPTGKMQRIGLAEQLGLTAAAPAQDSESEYAPPRTALEIALAAVWAETLGLDRVGVRNSFIQLGGDSILATLLLARVSDTFAVHVPIISLFEEASTVEGMAQAVQKLQRAGPHSVAYSLRAAIGESSPPLSYGQERFWFLQQLEPESSAYNRSLAFRLKGHLDFTYLERSLEEIVRRHAVLRSRVTAVNGAPIQTILPTASVSLQYLDLVSTPSYEQESVAARIARAQARQPFDLANGPPIRASVLRLDAQDHILLFVTHHSVCDGWSDRVFSEELSILYAAFALDETPRLPDLTLQYADYARAERAFAASGAFDESLAYWKQRLSGERAVLELPTDRPRPAIQTANGAALRFQIPGELLEALGELGRQEGVTRFMVLLAAFQILLHRYSEQTDISVGVPMAGRLNTDAEGLIGCFIKTLVLRTDLSGNPTFRELLARVREIALGGYSHQDLPFEKLIADLQPERSLSHSPLFQVFFQLRNLPEPQVKLHGLEAEPWDFDPGISPLDLSMDLREAKDGLHGLIIFNTDLFDASTIERMARHFHVLLTAAVSESDTPIAQLPILTPQERHQIVVEWNNTYLELPRDQCVHELFEAQAALAPDAVAVLLENQAMSYGELNQRANQLAHHLRTLGVGPEVLVGIAVERSLEMVVGVLGILKAGGAYVPLDPSHPPERLRFMLQDSGASIVVTQTCLRSRLDDYEGRLIYIDTFAQEYADVPMTNPHAPVTPEHLAYIMYTSGSTGKPKGVMIRHSSVVNLVIGESLRMELTAQDRMMIVSSLAFDASVLGLFAPLTHGGAVIIPDNEARYDGTKLLAVINRRNPRIIDAGPTTQQMLLDAAWKSESPITLMLGGETLERGLANRLLELGAIVWNPYGPTETTVQSTNYRVEPGEGRVPIGKPIANTTVYILDAHRQPVPVGVPGELYIGGAGVARGYLNRPDLTAERFVPNPFLKDGSILYRSGDRARYLPDGNLQFLGRDDSQVKVRGYRIELGEIEAALRAQPGVQGAVVVLRQDDLHDPRLTAYIVPEGGAAFDAATLHQALARTLPDYMLPAAFVYLDRFPTLPNGKLDRRALPVPQVPRAGAHNAPLTATEARIAAVWADVLGIERVGVDNTFFELGGSSLIAAQVISRLREAFQRDIPLRSIFETPTVASLARLVDRMPAQDTIPSAPPMVRLPREPQSSRFFGKDLQNNQ